MLVTPQIPSFLPFDATKDYELNFSIPTYSDQCVKNQIQIFKQSDNTLIYDNTTISFQLFCPIPISTLLNGVNYKCQIRTYNINNDFSEWSYMTSFLVLSPVLVDLFIPSIILSQSLNLKVTYSQPQGELMLSLKYILYDHQKNQLSVSREIFGSNLQYEFNLLENNTNYFAKCEVITQNGLLGYSEYIPFMTQYQAPRVNNVLELTNQYQDGAILASCEIIRILAHTVGNFTFESSEWINLTTADSMLYYDDNNGFSMDSNFTIKCWLKSIEEDEVFLTLYGYSLLDKIELRYYSNRIHVFKKSCNLVNHYISNLITILPTDTLFVFLVQKYNGVDIQCEII
ncbi:hypothetical protein [Clostridium sp.]|uniref:hypothetical protein n=1 Tax=Clostridium sp. TaxID=1506 RepID=UPI001A37C028|nr:hypothetical protein [Clostridium sp.]MBK5239832.1 hypothetical protein [Clostridium sp.]